MARTIVGRQNIVSPVAYDSNGDEIPGTSGIPISLNTLIAGEDQDNDLLRVEEQGAYTVCAFASTPVTVTSTAGKRLKGLVCTVANTGGVDIYDNTAASGTVLYSVASLTAGQIVDFPAAIIVTTGITVDLTTDGTVNCIWE